MKPLKKSKMNKKKKNVAKDISKGMKQRS